MRGEQTRETEHPLLSGESELQPELTPAQGRLQCLACRAGLVLLAADGV